MNKNTHFSQRKYASVDVKGGRSTDHPSADDNTLSLLNLYQLVNLSLTWFFLSFSLLDDNKTNLKLIYQSQSNKTREKWKKEGDTSGVFYNKSNCVYGYVVNKFVLLQWHDEWFVYAWRELDLWRPWLCSDNVWIIIENVLWELWELLCESYCEDVIWCGLWCVAR